MQDIDTFREIGDIVFGFIMALFLTGVIYVIMNWNKKF